MKDVSYSDQAQLDPQGIRMRLLSDILWLAVTGFTVAAIIGILCWPISAELAPRILAGATALGPTVRDPPETGASSVDITLASVYSADRIAPSVAPLTVDEGAGEQYRIDNLDRGVDRAEWPQIVIPRPQCGPPAGRAPRGSRKAHTGPSQATAKTTGCRAVAIPSAWLTSTTPASATGPAGRALTKVGVGAPVARGASMSVSGSVQAIMKRTASIAAFQRSGTCGGGRGLVGYNEAALPQSRMRQSSLRGSFLPSGRTRRQAGWSARRRGNSSSSSAAGYGVMRRGWAGRTPVGEMPPP